MGQVLPVRRLQRSWKRIANDVRPRRSLCIGSLHQSEMITKKNFNIGITYLFLKILIIVIIARKQTKKKKKKKEKSGKFLPNPLNNSTCFCLSLYFEILI